MEKVKRISGEVNMHHLYFDTKFVGISEKFLSCKHLNKERQLPFKKLQMQVIQLHTTSDS